MNSFKSNKPTASLRALSSKNSVSAVSPGKRPFLMKGQGKTIATTKPKIGRPGDKRAQAKNASVLDHGSESDLSRALSNSGGASHKLKSVHQRAMSTALKGTGELTDSDIERDPTSRLSKESDKDINDIAINTALIPGYPVTEMTQEIEPSSLQQEGDDAASLAQRRPRSSRRGSNKAAAARPASGKHVKQSKSISNLNQVESMMNKQVSKNIIVKNILPKEDLQTNIEQILASTSTNDVIRLQPVLDSSSRNDTQASHLGRGQAALPSELYRDQSSMQPTVTHTTTEDDPKGQYVSMFGKIAKKLIVNESPAYYAQTTEKKDSAAGSRLPPPEEDNSPVKYYNDQTEESLCQAPGRDAIKRRSDNSSILDVKVREAGFADQSDRGILVDDEEIEPQFQYSKPSQQYVRKSISEFLNQRINLSTVPIKNEWLAQSFLQARGPEQQPTGRNCDALQPRKSAYSIQNKEKLEAIDRELEKKKSRLMVTQRSPDAVSLRSGSNMGDGDQERLQIIDCLSDQEVDEPLVNLIKQQTENKRASILKPRPSVASILKTNSSRSSLKPMTQIQMNLKVNKTHTDRNSPVPTVDFKPEVQIRRLRNPSEHKKNNKSLGSIQMPSRTNTPFSQKSTPRANGSSTQKSGMRGGQPKSKLQSRSMAANKKQVPQESMQPKVSHFQQVSKEDPYYDLPMNKHTKGVEVILESEPILECSQKIDFNEALKNQLTSRLGTARKDEDVPDEAQMGSLEAPQQTHVKTRMPAGLVRNNSATGIGKTMSRQKSAGKLAHRAPVKQPSARAIFKTETKPAHRRGKTQLAAADSVPFDIGKPCQTELVESESNLPFAPLPAWNLSQLGSEAAFNQSGQQPRVTMDDLQRQYQTKIESYQDFYHNVKSYSTFDRQSHFQDFVVRKAEIEAKQERVRKSAHRKTASMFNEAVETQYIHRNTSVMSDRSNYDLGSEVAKLFTARKTEPKKKAPVVRKPALMQVISPPKQTKPFTAVTIQRQHKPSQSMAKDPPRPAAREAHKASYNTGGLRPSSYGNAGPKPLYEKIQSIKKYDYPFQRKVTPKRQEMASLTKLPATRKHITDRLQSPLKTVTGRSIANKPKQQQPLMTERQHQPAFKPQVRKAKPVVKAEPQAPKPTPVVTQKQIHKLTAQETKQMKKDAIFEQLKKELSSAFKATFIDDSMVWDEKSILNKDDYLQNTPLLSKTETQQVLTQMKYFTEEQQPIPGVSAHMLEKLRKLETYQFEDLMQTLKSKRYQLPGKRSFVPTASPSRGNNEDESGVTSIFSLISFIYAMNDICRDWMLIESKRPKPPPPVVEVPEIIIQSGAQSRRLSTIEQKLLGIGSLVAQQKQEERRSVLQRQKEEEKKMIKILEELRKSKERAPSSSSSESEQSNEESLGEYFMIRKKQEIGLLQEQFSYLVQNRAEYQEKRSKSTARSAGKIQMSRRLNSGMLVPSQERDERVPSSRNHQNIPRLGTVQEPQPRDLLNNDDVADCFGATQQQAFSQLPLENQRIVIDGMESPISKNDILKETISSRTCDQLPLQMAQTHRVVMNNKQDPKKTTQLRSARKLGSATKGQMSPIRPTFNMPPQSTPSQQAFSPGKGPTTQTRLRNQGNINKAKYASQIVTPITKQRDSRKNNQKLDFAVERTQVRGQQRLITHDDDNLLGTHDTNELKIHDEDQSTKNDNLLRMQPESLSRPRSQSKQNYQDNEEAEEPSPQHLIPQQSRPDFEIQPQSLSKTTSQHFKNIQGEEAKEKARNCNLPRQANINTPIKVPQGLNPEELQPQSNIKSIYNEERNVNFNINTRVTELELAKRQSSEDIFMYLQEAPPSEEHLRIQQDLNESLPITTQHTQGSPLRSSMGPEGNFAANRLSNLNQQSAHNRTSNASGEEPILILDIKLIKDKPEKIVVMETDVPEDLVERFCKQHPIDNSKKIRLLSVIKQQIQEYYLEQENSDTLGSPSPKRSDHRLSTMVDIHPSENHEIYQPVSQPADLPNYNCFEQSQPLTQIDEHEENLGNFSEEGEY